MGSINQFSEFENEKIFEKLANVCQKAKEKAEINRIVLKAINQTNFEKIGETKASNFEIIKFTPRTKLASALAVLILAVTSVFYFTNDKNDATNQIGYINDSLNQTYQIINTENSEKPLIKSENLIVYQF